MTKLVHVLLSAFITLTILMGASPVQSLQSTNTWTITTASDTSDGTCDTDCSLRDAISAANPGDTITFSRGLTITLRSALPAIDKQITIRGKGSANTILQASGCNPVIPYGACTPATYRVLTVGATGDLTLDGVTVQFGNDSGIYNQGALTLTNSVVWYNSSGYSGGGIFNEDGSALTATNSTISANLAEYGGGINNSGNVTLTNTVVSANRADLGGAIWNATGTTVATLRVTRSTFLSNGSDEDGGGIWNSGQVSVSDSAFYGNSAASGGAIYNRDGGTLTVNKSIFSGNSGHIDGGGIYSIGTLSVTGSSFLRNKANYFKGSGGGIYTDSSQATVTDSTFANNHADIGGAIFTTGTLSVSGSTFSANRSEQYGGGIYSTGFLDVTNSTFSANRTGEFGGGIYSGSELTVSSSTFSANASDNLGGGIENDGQMYMTNTIVANSVSGGDCNGTPLTNLKNLVEDGSCEPYYSGDPQLGALANNGGPTRTFALLAGSPAINRGDGSYCPATDQRGVSRPQGSTCDIGAYELK